MSLSKCQSCGELLREGEEVTARVKSVYHVLKSSIAFALDKDRTEYVKGSLRHTECPVIKGDC